MDDIDWNNLKKKPSSGRNSRFGMQIHGHGCFGADGKTAFFLRPDKAGIDTKGDCTIFERDFDGVKVMCPLDGSRACAEHQAPISNDLEGAVSENSNTAEEDAKKPVVVAKQFDMHVCEKTTLFSFWNGCGSGWIARWPRFSFCQHATGCTHRIC